MYAKEAFQGALKLNARASTSRRFFYLETRGEILVERAHQKLHIFHTGAQDEAQQKCQTAQWRPSKNLVINGQAQDTSATRH
jgi:hypothetical protein